MKKILVLLCTLIIVILCSCNALNNEPIVSKNEAIEQLLNNIYSDNQDSISTFSFSDTEELWGYEGNKNNNSDDNYQTMVLEFEKYSDNQEYYIFWFHERHYYNNEIDHDVTSNFYAVNCGTGQIIPERIYLEGGICEYNDKYVD